MTLNNKFEKAKSKLMLEHPYFGSIVGTMALEKNDDIESFRSQGKNFEYNDEYIDSLSIEELEFALANSAMHYALGHANRANKREGWLWQLATDYSINAMLLSNKMKTPDRINLDARFEGMYAEEIYAILESEINDKEYQEQEEERRDQEKKELSEETVEYMDEELLEQITSKIRKQDELPRELKRVFPELFSETIDWRSELYRYLNQHAKEDYQFFPPNKKYIHQGISLPSLKSERLKIVVAIDTSASIDANLLSLFMAHFQSIMDSFPSFEIDLIECDAAIQGHHTFYPGERITYELQGGGGTDFRPLFDYVDMHVPDTKIVLYFTDGLGKFPEQSPVFDTLWVSTENITVPFGEVLIVSQ